MKKEFIDQLINFIAGVGVGYGIPKLLEAFSDKRTGNTQFLSGLSTTIISKIVPDSNFRKGLETGGFLSSLEGKIKNYKYNIQLKR